MPYHLKVYYDSLVNVQRNGSIITSKMINTYLEKKKIILNAHPGCAGYL